MRSGAAPSGACGAALVLLPSIGSVSLFATHCYAISFAALPTKQLLRCPLKLPAVPSALACIHFGNLAQAHQCVTGVTCQSADCSAGVLLYHLEAHTGITILITNKPDAIDSAFQRRITFSLEFPMPDAALRSVD